MSLLARISTQIERLGSRLDEYTLTQWRRALAAASSVFGGGYRPRPSSLPKSPPRGGSMGVPPKMGPRSGGYRARQSVNPRTVRPPRGGPAVRTPRCGQSARALIDHVKDAKHAAYAAQRSNAANIANLKALRMRLDSPPAPNPTHPHRC